MTELEEYLEVAGFEPRRSQTDLYEHLIGATQRGVIAQAGTGTGKSAAVISAAAHMARATQTQSLIVTPTLTLMNQYRDGDLPVAYDAFPDLVFAELRGRAHYWCEMTKSGYDVMQSDYFGGCDGADGGCTLSGWAGHDDCETGCQSEHEIRWNCEYQAAKSKAMLCPTMQRRLSRSSRNQSGCAGRASGPLSPPAMIQWTRIWPSVLSAICSSHVTSSSSGSMPWMAASTSAIAALHHSNCARVSRSLSR